MFEALPQLQLRDIPLCAYQGLQVAQCDKRAHHAVESDHQEQPLRMGRPPYSPHGLPKETR